MHDDGSVGLLRGGVSTGGLDDYIHAEISPRQCCRPVGDGPRFDHLVPDHNVLADDRHLVR
jgi:hypothetical protein